MSVRLNVISIVWCVVGMDIDGGDEGDLDLMSEDELSGDELELRESQKKEERMVLAQKELFKDCFFFLEREVSKSPLVLCIRSCGGSVTWQGDTRHNLDVSDESITHHVTDRGSPLSHRYLLREYVQPQWVFDCVNCRRCLSLSGYRPGDTLPPHLSPFMQEKEGDYIPPERLAIIQLERDENLEKSDSELSEKIESGSEAEEDRSAVAPEGGVKKRKLKRKRPLGIGQVIHGQVNKPEKIDDSLEEDKLRAMLLTKKKRKLYEKLKGRDKHRSNKINKLRERRKQIERKKTLESK